MAPAGRVVADTAVARLRLIRTTGIGPVTYRQLIARFGSAQAAIDALPTLAARGGGRVPRVADRTLVDREMAATARLGARYLFVDDPDYPRLLAETATDRTKRMPDLAGVILIMAGVSAMTLGVVQRKTEPGWGWLGARTWLCFVVGASILTWFVLRCRRHPGQGRTSRCGKQRWCAIRAIR